MVALSFSLTLLHVLSLSPPSLLFPFSLSPFLYPPPNSPHVYVCICIYVYVCVFYDLQNIFQELDLKYMSNKITHLSLFCL